MCNVDGPHALILKLNQAPNFEPRLPKERTLLKTNYTQGSMKQGKVQNQNQNQRGPLQNQELDNTLLIPSQILQTQILQMSNLDCPLFVWLVFLCVGTVWNLQGEKSTVCVSDSEKKETCSEVQAITPPTLFYSNSGAVSPSVFWLIAAAAAKVHVYNSRQLPLLPLLQVKGPRLQTANWSD